MNGGWVYQLTVLLVAQLLAPCLGNAVRETGNDPPAVPPFEPRPTTIDGMPYQAPVGGIQPINNYSEWRQNAIKPVRRDDQGIVGLDTGQSQQQEPKRTWQAGLRAVHEPPTPIPTRKTLKAKSPLPPKGPHPSQKTEVQWYDINRAFAYKAPSEYSRLLVRHAPIPQSGSPWPLPQHYYPETTLFLLHKNNFFFNNVGEGCDIIDFAFHRIRRNIFGEEGGKEEEEREDSDPNSKPQGGSHSEQDPIKEIHTLNVTVLKECEKFPHLDMDESYDLEVKRSGASIIAREVWGALRGLETFSQLVFQDKSGQYLVNRTFINDFPRFKHRGILLDTARHYIKKEVILANLEAMAQNKMNIFHWHIVDDQSFPFESRVFPNLTLKGAYDPMTHIYSQEDVLEVIEEARLRGIRVVPEFDSPGHTLSWGYGTDNLLTPCYDYDRRFNGWFGPINPILKSTYIFLQQLFEEILSVFQDKYVHLGGDEVPFDCWSSNPQINKFIGRNNLSDVRDVLNLYEKKLVEIISNLGAKRPQGSGYTVWQEVVDNGVKVKPDTIVQVWMGDTADIERITNRGLRVVFSSCWYLDYINYGQDWDKYYRCDQIGSMLDEYHIRNESLLIGGEAALWTEYASDSNIISRLWPRASAAAERLWSDRKVKDEIAAAPRLEEQRCRMIRRGLQVGVLSGPGHCPSPPQPNKPAKSSQKSSFLHGLGLDFGVKHPIKNDAVEKNQQDLEVRVSYPQVYVVDVQAMYLVPVLLVVCVCCVALLSLAQDSRSKLASIFSFSINGSGRRGVRSLVYIFLFFVVIWCIWTAPIWLNSWENPRKTRLQSRHYDRLPHPGDT